MARLIIKTSTDSPRQMGLGERCVVGRRSGVDCVLESMSVSRWHAIIENRDGGFFLSDLGSRNGTFLNGEQLTNAVRLSNRDLIRIGDESLQFLDDEARKDARSEVTELLTRNAAAASKSSVPTKPLELRHSRLQLPRTIGKFQLRRLLGKGGMGAVYLAHDLEADRDVAVKFILSKIGRHEWFLDFFHNREAVLARQIDHPNVTRVFEHGVHKNHHFISMEHVPGKNLHQLMKEYQLSVPETLEILRQVACGLNAAHQQGVVHSDIKPANILLLGAPGASPADDTGKVPEDDGETILEFDPSSGDTAGESAARYDPELIKEIRRRAGVLPEDLLRSPPYFRRASEMRFLEHYFQRLQQSHGCVVVVAGEKGTGKTRLINEFVKRQQEARDSNTGVVTRGFFELDCSAEDGLQQIFERIHSSPPPDTLEENEVANSLARKVGTDSTPTVITITGLEFVRPLTSRLIRTWARQIDEKPLLIIADVDPDEVERNAALREILSFLKPAVKELFLRPLTEYQIQRYLDQIFGQKIPILELSGDLFRLTGGKFSRLLEVLGSFFDRKLLRVDPDGRKIAYRPNSREFELEEGKHLYKIFKSYGRVEQQILEYAAFTGSRFYFDTLRRLQDVDETALFFMLRIIVADGFLVEEEKTRYRFTNETFRRYLAERFAPHERPRLHRKVAILLHSASVPQSAELYQLKAHHYASCKNYTQAVEFLLEGAYRAKILYNDDLLQEMYHDILRIYRSLSAHETLRREIRQTLQHWFGREGNWYAILAKLATENNRAWVKIADFGISFRVARDRVLQIDGPAMGTPRYMAPERSGRNRGGPASDVFSLGIVAHELIVGEAPFPELAGWKVHAAYRTRPIRIPKEHVRNLPPTLVELLGGMLERDPSRRWDIEQVLRTITDIQLELNRNVPP